MFVNKTIKEICKNLNISHLQEKVKEKPKKGIPPLPSIEELELNDGSHMRDLVFKYKRYVIKCHVNYMKEEFVGFIFLLSNEYCIQISNETCGNIPLTGLELVVLKRRIIKILKSESNRKIKLLRNNL